MLKLSETMDNGLFFFNELLLPLLDLLNFLDVTDNNIYFVLELHFKIFLSLSF